MSAHSPSVESLSLQNPWRGFLAYMENDREFFLGREHDTGALLALVQRATVVVLYGQSGLGKTSVVQAGLLPALRDLDFLPIRLQLDHGENAPTFARQIKAALAAELDHAKVAGPRPGPDETLWEFFHRRDTDFWGPRNRLLTPVIVLDQFEEAFTLGQQNEIATARVAEFAAELAALIEHNPTDAVRRRLEANLDEARKYDLRRQAVKFIFSLREDFLPHLDTWRERMPSLLPYRYRLERMTGAQALEVVQRAGRDILEPSVARNIVDFVSTSQRARAARELEQREVEPALLSVVCDELNRRRRADNQSRITADLLTGQRENIIQGFYERAFDGLDARVHDWVEDELLTASGYRQRAALDDALKLGLPQTAFNQLVDRHILHREERDGLIWLELTHDLLTDPAARSREFRQQRQLVEAAEREREAQRRRVRRLAWVSLLLALFGTAMAVLGLIAWQQSHRANKAFLESEQQYEEARKSKDDAEKQAQRAQTAQKSAEAEGSRAEEALKEVTRQKTNAEKAKQEAEAKKLEALNAAEEAQRQTVRAKMASEELRKQTAVAEEAEKTARDERDYFERTMNGMLSSLSTELQKIGHAELLRDATEKALGYYNRGAGSALGQSEASLSRRFGAFTNLGHALAIQGDTTNAVQAFEKGLEIARTMAKIQPGSTNWVPEQAFCFARMGDIWADRADTLKAVEGFQQSLDITSHLARDHPDDPDLQRSLFSLHLRIGDVWYTRGLKAKAIAEYETAVEIATPYTNLPDFHRELAYSYSRAGPLWLERWGSAQAIAKCEDGLKFATDQAAKDPANLQWQSDLALACENKGDVLLKVSHDSRGALQQYRRAQTMRLELVKDRSANMQWNLDLLRNDFKIGRALDPRNGPVSEESPAEQILENFKLAKEVQKEEYRRSLEGWRLLFSAKARVLKSLEVLSAGEEIAEKLAQKDPSNFQFQTDLAGINLQMGDMLLYAKATSDALLRYRVALDITRRLADNDTNNTEVQYRLAVSLAKIAVAQQRLSKPAEAVEEVRQALDVLQSLAERWPGNFILWKGMRADGRNFKSMEPTDIEQLRKVFAAYEAKSKIAGTEALKDPANPSLKEDLGRACAALAIGKLLVGDLVAAMSEETNAVAVWQELWQAAPTNNFYKTRLERAYVALASMQLINRQPQDAIRSSLHGQALDSSLPEFKAILALGYVIAGPFEKAKAIILENNLVQVGSEQTFGEAIQDDLLEFSANGWTQPGIKEAQALFAPSKDPK
jgi:tetratricopeptide (TPR) repeat protein